jgi:hypothetical protein
MVLTHSIFDQGGWLVTRFEFWQQTYVAAIRGGRGVVAAKECADAAITQLEERFNLHPLSLGDSLRPLRTSQSTGRVQQP